jgi:hypothetical protein
MSDFLEDGYTERGYIAAADGLHGPLEFEYRPALGKLSDRIAALIQGERPNWDAYWDAMSKALASEPKLLLTWSLKNSKDEDVPITAANVQRCKQAHKLWSIVCGMRPSDSRPDGSRPKQPDLEADAKN